MVTGALSKPSMLQYMRDNGIRLSKFSKSWTMKRPARSERSVVLCVWRVGDPIYLDFKFRKKRKLSFVKSITVLRHLVITNGRLLLFICRLQLPGGFSKSSLFSKFTQLSSYSFWVVNICMKKKMLKGILILVLS